MEMLVIVVVCVAVALGCAALAWRKAVALAGLQAELAVARERAGRVDALEAARGLAEDKRIASEREAARVQQANTDLLARVEAAEAERDAARAEAARLAAEKEAAATALAAQAETLAQERRGSAEKIALLQQAREEMTREFKLLAGTIMQQHGEAFQKQNREQIDLVLTPLREKLVEFQNGLASAHTETAKERAALKQQIERLSADSARMTSETSNLARALKGKSQTQGAWGEMVLATILERSGLRPGEEYVTQSSTTTEEGQRLRPDVIVNLPGGDGRRIVIDAKVSLTAFEAHVNAETEEERAAQLKAHVASLRQHIRTLGDKSYQVHTRGELDYVIMFVPIEGALAAALQEAPGLTAEALERNVNIATPTTLMIALRTAASVWQVERRNRNADEIARRAGQLYDKVAGFVGDMETLGSRLKAAQTTYDGAMGKLATGSGNVLRQVEMLKTLGARASKALPAALLDAAGGDAGAEPSVSNTEH